MLLIDNDPLYHSLTCIHANNADHKYLYLSLFDISGKPLDPRIPLRFGALKKVEIFPDRFVFHDFGRNTFAIIPSQVKNGSKSA